MPKELWKNSIFSGGINTAVSAADLQDNDFSESLNCALTRKGNLSSEVALVHPPSSVTHDMIDVSPYSPNLDIDIRLIPEAGCFTFRHDLSFISGQPFNETYYHNENVDSAFPQFASWGDFDEASDLANSEILTTDTDNSNYGYNYILIPYLKWDSHNNLLTSGLLLGQSQLNFNGEFFYEHWKEDLEFLKEQTINTNVSPKTHPFNFWRWKYDQFDMGHWDYNAGDFTVQNYSGEDWIAPIHGVTLHEIIKTMPKSQRPNFGYIYIDGKLRVYNRNTAMGWEPKTLDIVRRSYDVNMTNTNAVTLTTASHYTMKDNPAEGVMWRDAYLRSPMGHAWSRTGFTAFTVGMDGPVGIKNAHQLDVLFMESDGDNDETISEIGIYRDIQIGYTFVSHDGQETAVNIADEYTFAGYTYPPIMQVRMVRNNTDLPFPESYHDEFKWDPWISGVRIYVRYKDLSGWYETMHIDFDSGSWSMFNNKKGEFYAVDQENQQAGSTIQAPWCLEMKDQNNHFPILNSYPSKPYSANNQRKSGEEEYPLYSCHAVVGRTVFIGNVVDKHGTHHGDTMLKSAVNMFDTFPIKATLEAKVNDGDEIMALESLGKYLIQFKRSSIYIIEVSGGIEAIVKEYHNNGVVHPRSVAKGESSIAWANQHGCFVFDGKSITNLIDNKISKNHWMSHYGYYSEAEEITDNGQTESVFGHQHNNGYIELGFDPYNKKLICQYRRNIWESRIAEYQQTNMGSYQSLELPTDPLDANYYCALGNTEKSFVYDLNTNNWNMITTQEQVGDMATPWMINTSGESNFLNTKGNSVFGPREIMGTAHPESEYFEDLKNLAELNPDSFPVYDEYPGLFRVFEKHINAASPNAIIMPSYKYTVHESGEEGRESWEFATKDMVFKEPGRTKRIYNLWITYKNTSQAVLNTGDIKVYIKQNGEINEQLITDLDANAVKTDFTGTINQWNIAKIDLGVLNSRTSGGIKGLRHLIIKIKVTTKGSQVLFKDMSISHKVKIT